ncbi:tetratricopeptide repeat protein [Pseudaestuariivita rosea]|uniref:tetratricopeptide repeat protein n=1 Tax=Pseudaestuariivita rosea TaxID=2763263 RepID=UPI001ABBD37D|nr:tetratricopeptide repeat protein [Pseudaestuariivita rosea]
MTRKQHNVLVLMAQTYVRLGHSRHALSLLHPVLKADPDHVLALRAAAQAQLDVGENDRAISTCEHLLSIETGFSARKGIQLLLSRALFRANSMAKARRAFAAAQSTSERSVQCNT